VVYTVILVEDNYVGNNDNSLSKQFLMLNGKPIIVYSLNQFLKNERIYKIIIICASKHLDCLKEIINKYIKDSNKIEVVESSKTRNESVIKGCNYISDKYGLKDEDVVIVHDSDNPFITQRIINENIDNVLKYRAVGTAIPATNTIFESTDNQFVSNIFDKNYIFQAQSPESFNIKRLMNFYNKVSKKEKETATKCCKIFTLKGEKVKLVEGDITNIKVTSTSDLARARDIVNSETYTGDSGTFPYKIKKRVKNILKRVDLFSLITLIGIITSFLILDIGIRYFSSARIDFYSTKEFSPLLFSLSYIMIIVFVIYTLPKKISPIFYGCLYGMFWFYTLAQVIHFKIFNLFFTINDILLVGEANQHLNFIWSYFGKKAILFFIISLLIGIVNIVLINKSSGFFGSLKKKVYMLLIIVFVLFARFRAVSLLGEPIDEFEWNAWNRPRNIYNTYSNPNKSLRVSGIYEYVFRDIYINVNKKIFRNDKELIEIVENHRKQKLTSGYQEQNSLNSIFKDKNLIMIMLESVDNWLVTEDVMPALFRLQNDGWNFTNRYAPQFASGFTINTEFSSITGLHTPTQGSSSYNYSRNLFPFSLPNLFKKKGYVANSIHFNRGDFYNRTNLHKALGFDNHFSLLDNGFSYKTQDDRELVNNDNIYKLIVPDSKQKFMSFITTYSVHGPYNETNFMCKNILQENKELTVDDDIELMCIKELSKITDEFIEGLIQRLEEDKLIDDTILVLFSDHYVYGYSKVREVKKIYDANLSNNVPFIIWHNSINSKVIDTIVDSADFTPTLANLFGLDLDERNYVGTDVFSSNHDNFVYFGDYSWYDGNVYYKGEDISNYKNQEYIEETSIKVNNKIKLNNAILNSDYYRYVIKDASK